MKETNEGAEPWKSEPSQHGDGGEKFGDADHYFNEDGFVVFTAEYLLERGYCCGNGCKNCPYDYKAVPEPKRSKLLEQRKKNETNQ